MKQRLIRVNMKSKFCLLLLCLIACSCTKSKEHEVPIIDIDANIYTSVTLGNQVWMVENLKTTRYNDGTEIYHIADESWLELDYGAYCYYNNNDVNKNTFGALYNWHAVNTGKLCPAGWHVPSEDEWISLMLYLERNGYGYGGSGGDIAKSMASSSGWNPIPEPVLQVPEAVGTNQASNNSSGFTGQPAGNRFGVTFNDLHRWGYWWSSTIFQPEFADFYYNQAMSFSIANYSIGVDRYEADMSFGFSVRCIKD